MNVVSLPALLLSGLALASATMVLVWALALRVRNMGLVDVAWSFLFTPLAWLYLSVAGHGGPRQNLMATAVSVWSVRLGWHLLVRLMADHPSEDSRYEQLRRDWAGTRVSARFFWFFQAQAVAAVGLTGPMAVVAADTERLPDDLRAVTGVPNSEAASLRSRGDKYRAYKRTTSRFVPWFPARPGGPDYERA